MDRYVITGKIGEGAHGIVLKAHDVVAEKHVALKKLLLKNIKNGISTSITREIKILQQLKHCNVCLFQSFYIIRYSCKREKRNQCIYKIQGCKSYENKLHTRKLFRRR